MGELSHGDAQSSLLTYVRVQVLPERFRVPDVSILRGSRQAKDGTLINQEGDLAVPLAEVFADG